ncbi:MAG: hypothetical protein V4598_07820 [Bdellovibrionota bacterium]
MRSKRKILAVVLCFQVTLANAQAVNSRCSFESQLAPDEQSLLDGVKTALTPMSNNPACQAQAGQIRTFEQALTAYNQQSNALSGGGISCMNYEGEWNSRFDHFANNWNSPGDSSDPYASCRTKSNREEAIQCAALVTGQQKSTKKSSCESQRDSITIAASQELRTQTFQTGLTALNDVILNPDCMNSAGERRLNLIQNAVGLASQAATISLLGTGVGLLVGGAAQLVNAAIGSIFRNPSRQAMAILDNRENFSKIACLYEQIESKSLRCDRISASRQVDVLRNMFDQSTQFCDTNADVLNHNDLMTSIDQTIRNLNVQPAQGQTAPALTQDNFDNLVERLNEHFPGSEETKLNVAEQTAREVKEILDLALENDDKLVRYLEATTDEPVDTSTQLRRHHRELTGKRDRAAAVLALVTAVKEADAKGTRMGEEDRRNVEQMLKGFNAGNMSFTGVFNEIMMERAVFHDDLGTSLRAYNTRLNEANYHRQNVQFYQNLNRVSSSSFEDGGRFAEARTAITPHLQRVLRKEMDTLIDRVNTLHGITPGTPTPALRETLRTQEESVIYPMLRICNQLRTVMAGNSRGNLNASADGQPSVCQAFNCQNGLNTFDGYLQAANITGINPSSCDVNCRSHYDRFVCQEKSSLASSRDRVKKEFLERGTVCGKSIRDAFRKAESH